MIITIKGDRPNLFADSNIGTLDSWSITKSLGKGCTYSGPSSIKKDLASTSTITITVDTANYILGGVRVLMGSDDMGDWITINEGTITIAVPAGTSITGNIKIEVATTAKAVEPETPVYYTITYKYVDNSGATIQADTTESVVAGTVKIFSAPVISGYTVSSVSPSGTQTINSDTTVTYTYTADSGAGDGDIGDSGNDGSVRLVFSEVDNYQSGFVNKRSVFQESDSHYHCSIPAANVQSVTITPLMVQEESTTVWYVTYKSDAGATQWWGCLAEITPNEPLTIDFSGMADGTIYFNDFYDKNGVLQYPRYADIVYV